MNPWKMLLVDAVLFAGLCWLPIGMFALGRATDMPNPLLWVTTAVTALIGPVQFLVQVWGDHRPLQTLGTCSERRRPRCPVRIDRTPQTLCPS